MSRGFRKWPEDRIRRLVALWPDPTKTIRVIAREFGVSWVAVERRAKHLGLAGRPASRRDPWPCDPSLVSCLPDRRYGGSPVFILPGRPGAGRPRRDRQETPASPAR
jgi:hypothetical protein